MQTHACPGGCGTEVIYDRLACTECWARLPQVLRAEITAAYRGRGKDWWRHLRAIQAARRWYRDAGVMS